MTDTYDAATEICLVQQTSATAYTPTGRVAAQTDGDGNVTSYKYNPLGEETTETDPPTNPSQPGALPVTTYAFDTLGRETSKIDPIGNITAYLYGYGDYAGHRYDPPRPEPCHLKARAPASAAIQYSVH